MCSKGNKVFVVDEYEQNKTEILAASAVMTLCLTARQSAIS